MESDKLKRHYFGNAFKIHNPLVPSQISLSPNGSVDCTFCFQYILACSNYALNTTHSLNGKCNHRSFVGYSVRQEDVPGGQNRRR